MGRLYDKADWRQLPRDGTCAAAEFLPGDCSGELHLHHVEGHDDDRTALLCRRHHPMVEALLRRSRRWRRCTHYHPYPGGRDECERKLNRF